MRHERSQTPPSLLIDIDQLREMSAQLQDLFHPEKNRSATARETALVYNICTGILGACDEVERARAEMEKVDELKAETGRLLSIVASSAEALSLVVLKQNEKRESRGMFEEAFSNLLKHAVAVKFQRQGDDDNERPTPADGERAEQSFEVNERNPFIEGPAPSAS